MKKRSKKRDMGKKKEDQTINPSEISGKLFALLLWGKKSDGKEDDVAIFTGRASFKEGILTVDLKGNPNFEILPEWLSRIKKTTKDVKKTMLNAEYFLSLSVGAMTENDSGFQKTGLKWPKS